MTMDHQAKNKLIRAIGWLMLVTLILLSLIRLPVNVSAVPSGDKWMHLISYLLLSYWFFHAYVVHPVKITLGLMLLGAAVELLQGLTPYRHMEWLDLLANMLGVCLALGLFHGMKIQVKPLLVWPDKK